MWFQCKWGPSHNHTTSRTLFCWGSLNLNTLKRLAAPEQDFFHIKKKIFFFKKKKIPNPNTTMLREKKIWTFSAERWAVSKSLCPIRQIKVNQAWNEAEEPRDKAPLSRLQIRLERGASGPWQPRRPVFAAHNSSPCIGLPYLVTDKRGGACKMSLTNFLMSSLVNFYEGINCDNERNTLDKTKLPPTPRLPALSTPLPKKIPQTDLWTGQKLINCEGGGGVRLPADEPLLLSVRFLLLETEADKFPAGISDTARELLLVGLGL